MFFPADDRSQARRGAIAYVLSFGRSLALLDVVEDCVEK